MNIGAVQLEEEAHFNIVCVSFLSGGHIAVPHKLVRKTLHFLLCGGETLQAESLIIYWGHTMQM